MQETFNLNVVICAKNFELHEIALLDSGSKANIITMNVIERGQLGEALEKKEESKDMEIVGVGPGGVPIKGSIELTWHASNATKNHKDTFYVVDNLDYDMILGVEWMKRYYSFKAKEHTIEALPIRLRHKSKGLWDS